MDTFYLLSGSKADVLDLDIKPVNNNNYDHYIVFKVFYNNLTETKNKIDLYEKKQPSNKNLFNRNINSNSNSHFDSKNVNVNDNVNDNVDNVDNENGCEGKFELVVNKNVAKAVDNWHSVKKLTNTYEMVHTHNKSIAYYIPVSRSYFKIIEILHEFELFKNFNDSPITIVSVAEAPGGFIEYMAKYRIHMEDRIYGLTLKGDNSSVPSWQRLHNSLNKMHNKSHASLNCGNKSNFSSNNGNKSNVSLNSGNKSNISLNCDNKSNISLNYGNMYNIDEIIHFISKIGKKASIVTADGGFDYTTNFNYQEQESYRLIYSEILTALMVQEVGGNFVCKIFDIFSVLSLKMVYLIHCLYEKVYIYKPKTSRLANSEKYLVAIGFKGISKVFLAKLTNIHSNWIDSENRGVIDLSGIVLPSNFIQSIFVFNKNYVQSQIDNINLTLSMIITPPSKAVYQKITNQQISKALEWCEKYKEPINYKWSKM